MKMDISKLLQKLTKSKFILPILLAACALLLLLPKKGGDSEKTSQSGIKTETETSGLTLGMSLKEEEARLKETLEYISGAGRVEVLLSLSASGERVFAENGGEIAVISTGSGREEAVELYSKQAEYQGAVIVSEGASSAEVRLNLAQAVMSFTGLPSDRITILQMN